MTFYDYLLAQHTRPTESYGAKIESATKCLPDEIAAIESLMRDEHPTLDGLASDQFVRIARECHESLLSAKNLPWADRS